MSIERAIHERWQTDHRLNGLIPTARVFTGAAWGSAERPYAVLERRTNRRLFRTSSGRKVDELALRVSIWASDLGQAKEVAGEISRRFDRTSFPWSAGQVLHMQRTSDAERIEADGTWVLRLDYRVVHFEDTGTDHG
jgi:Protein of unknown function (DUF3168)